MNIKQLVIKLSQSMKSLKNEVFYANRYFCGKNTAQKIGNLSMSTTENLSAQSAEYGRSMVEMLGVLAIIGVLSVTAILGYRYAMTKYIANETINEINLRARDISFDMEAMIENNYSGDIEMKMGPITRMGYPIRARISPQYIDYFEIFVSNVPTDVCKELLRMPWRVPYSIFVGVEEFEASIGICEQAETVELAYEFYKDMSSKDEIDEDNRHEIMRCKQDSHCICGTCNIDTGLCESYCLDSQTCKKDYDDSRWMVCCDEDYIVGDFCCASVTADGQCCNREGRCCPTEKPLQDKDGNCHSCDEMNGVDVGEYAGNCATCPKRYLGGGYNGRNYCSLCGVEGTPVEDKPLFHDSYGVCKGCDDTGVVNQTGIYSPYLCKTFCPERDFLYNYVCTPKCSAEAPLRINTSSCDSCNYPSAVAIGLLTEPCENICPNREEKNGYCILKTCPNDKPLKDKNGACYSCSEITGINVGNYPEYCDVCPERHIETVSGVNYCTLPCGLKNSAYENKPLVDKEGNCHTCDELNADTISTYLSVCSNQFSSTGYTDRTCCSICGIPGTSTENKPLQGANGSCYACSEIKAVNVGRYPELCDVCNERIIQEDSNTNYCILDCDIKGTPTEGKPLKDRYGNCYSCDEINGVDVGKFTENCSVCPKRYLGGGYNGINYCTLCGVKGTPVEDKPLFHDSYGICKSCDDADIINQSGVYTPYLCKTLCPTRDFLYNYVCVQKCSAETPLRINTSGCDSCDYSLPVPMALLSKPCEETCPNRAEQNGYCVRLKCSTQNQLLGADNNCYPCNISIHVKSTEEECQKCLNTRIYENGYCKLNYNIKS